MKKLIISSALIGILFTGLLSVTNVYTAGMSNYCKEMLSGSSLLGHRKSIVFKFAETVTESDG